MKRPGPLAYLFGNPLTLLASLGATAFFGYEWWSANASPLPAIIAFLIFCQTMRATDQLQKYNDWKREWEAVEGKPRTATTGLNMKSPLVRILIGVPAWAVGLYLVTTLGDDAPSQIAKACFWLGTALGIGGLIYRNLPRRRQAASTATKTYPDVSVCLAVPHASPSVAEARALTPGYCQTLMR